MTEVTMDSVAELYVATFNRAPDAAGLNYWVYDSGLSWVEDIAQSFFDQSETQELYPPTVTNREFVESVYQNLFNREPDSAGWDYWEDQLNSNSVDRSVFIEAVINGALGDDKSILENKKEVGLYFAESGLNDVEEAKKVMDGIDASLDSLNSKISYIYSIKDVNPLDDIADGVYTANYVGDETGMMEFAVLPDNTIQGVWVSATYGEYGSLSGEVSSDGSFRGWTDDGSATATGLFIDEDTLLASWVDSWGSSGQGTFEANLVNTDITTLGTNGIIEYAESLGIY